MTKTMTKTIYVAVGALLLSTVTTFGCGDGGSTAPSSTSSGGQGGSGSTGSTGSTGSAGGTASTGSTGTGSMEYATYCQAAEDRASTCSVPLSPDDITKCLGYEACDLTLFRPGVIPVLHACLNARPCDTSDMDCLASTTDAQADTASSTAYGKGCTDAIATCSKGGTPLPSNYCETTYKLLQDPVLDQMTACFTKSCAELPMCLDGVIDAINAPCKK